MLSQMSSCFLFPSLQISFGWSTVKIDMSAVRQFQPLMPFSVPAFAATLFALGLALGTTIAVGMLFIIQVRFLLECTIYRSCWRWNMTLTMIIVGLTLHSQKTWKRSFHSKKKSCLWNSSWLSHPISILWQVFKWWSYTSLTQYYFRYVKMQPGSTNSHLIPII